MGSQGFEAKMRMVAELRTDPNDSGLKHLCILKGNYISSENKDESYVLEFDENMTFHNTGNRSKFDKIKETDEKRNRTQEKEIAKELIAKGKSIRETAETLNKKGYSVSKSAIGRWIKG